VKHVQWVDTNHCCSARILYYYCIDALTAVSRLSCSWHRAYLSVCPDDVLFVLLSNSSSVCGDRPIVSATTIIGRRRLRTSFGCAVRRVMSGAFVPVRLFRRHSWCKYLALVCHVICVAVRHESFFEPLSACLCWGSFGTKNK
jgi:hypothetical protein